MQTSTGIGALFSALGVNVPALCFDASAFLIFSWLMGKYVFPILTAAIDTKRDELVATTRNQQASQALLASAEQKATKIIERARASADEALARAEADATETIKAARIKAEEQAARIVSDAAVSLDKSVEAARLALKQELATLVMTETEKVLGHELSAGIDSKVIAKSLGGSAS